jgi:cytidine deaminase
VTLTVLPYVAAACLPQTGFYAAAVVLQRKGESVSRPHASSGEFESLIAAAKSTRENAHAAYSNFRVGAGLRATSGRIFGGCNVENATYGLTVCAERVAIFKAISEGERGFDAIAVVTDTDALTPPCGACRQLIWEFCGDVPVILANLKGKVEIIAMKELFPKPFDASSL